MNPRRLTLDEFASQLDHYDSCVGQTPDIDHFCSSAAWVVPALTELMPGREPWIARDGDAYLVLALSQHPRGFLYAESFEAMWGLACPLVAPTLEQRLALLEWALRGRLPSGVVAISGLAKPGIQTEKMMAGLQERWRVERGPISTRLVADISGSFDAYWRGRSRNLRRSMGRAEKLAAEEGVDFVEASGGCGELYDRLQRVESRSWKGREGVGIESGPMHGFYRAMIERLTPGGGLRLSFARRHGQDIGYLLGGVVGRRFRGLQCSFDDDYRALSLGNLMQLHAIRRLCQEGVVSYDLGAAGLDYKNRWAGEVAESMTVVVVA